MFQIISAPDSFLICLYLCSIFFQPIRLAESKSSDDIIRVRYLNHDDRVKLNAVASVSIIKNLSPKEVTFRRTSETPRELEKDDEFQNECQESISLEKSKEMRESSSLSHSINLQVSGMCHQFHSPFRS